MRKGIEVKVAAGDRARLEGIVADRNRRQKHVERARIVLLSAEGLGTLSIMRQVGCAKATVWRWQERSMAAGVAGLLQDKSRPPGKTPLSRAVVERVVDLTLGGPPGEATHWTGRAMAQAVGASLRSVQRIWAAHGLQPHRVKRFKLSKDAHSPPSSRTSSVCTSIRRPMRSCCPWTKRARSRRSIGPSRACR
jgi:Homeodomain-like domain